MPPFGTLQWPPPSFYGEPDPYAFAPPADDLDGFDNEAFLRSVTGAREDAPRAEFETPFLPPPDESPVPDVAFAPPESPVPDAAWLPLGAGAQPGPARSSTPPADAVPSLGFPTPGDAAGPDPFAVPVESDGRLDMPDDPSAPAFADADLNDDRINEGALEETGPDTAAGFNERVAGLTRDPVALAEETARLERMRASEIAVRTAEANEQRVRDIEDLAKRREMARAAAERDLADITERARNLADSSPFEAHWESRSAFGKLGGIVNAIFGGLMSPKTGGRNSGIDFMMKIAEDDANAKLVKIREQRGLAQDAMSAADDDFKTGMALKLAGYEQVLRLIDSKAANMDPQGTAAAAIAQARQDVLAKMAAARAAAGQLAFKNNEETLKRLQEDQKIRDEQAKNEAARLAKLEDIKVAKWNAGTSARAQKETERHNREMEKRQNEADAATMRIERDALIRAQETAGPRIAKVKRVQNPDGTTRFETEFVPFVNAPAPVINPVNGRPVIDPATGKPVVAEQEWKAPSPPVAEKLNKQFAAVSEVTKLGHQMIDIIETEGWQSDTALSKKYQEAMQAWAQAMVTLKDVHGLGVIAGPDLPLLQKALGTSDPTQWRDTTGGIRKGIDNAILKYEEQMRGQGQYTGPSVAFAFEPEPVEPGMTETQKLVRKTGGAEPAPTLAQPGEGTEAARVPTATGPAGPTGPIRAGQVPAEVTTPEQASEAIGKLIARATGQTFRQEEVGDGGTKADSQKAALIGLKTVVKNPQYRGEAMQAVLEAGITFDGKTQPWLVDADLERRRRAYAAAMSEQLGDE